VDFCEQQQKDTILDSSTFQLEQAIKNKNKNKNQLQPKKQKTKIRKQNVSHFFKNAAKEKKRV